MGLKVLHLNCGLIRVYSPKSAANSYCWQNLVTLLRIVVSSSSEANEGLL